MKETKGQNTVFLDRDGTLIEEVNFLHRVEDLRFFDYSDRAVSLLKNAGFLVVIVTNQSGIGRGIYTAGDMHSIHEKIQSDLSDKLDAFYFCPHLPDEGCVCRKPRLGMIEQAMTDFDIDLERSWIGATSITAAVYQPASSNIPEIIQASKDVQLLVLPELTLDSASLLASLQDSLQDSNTYVVTSIQENDSHVGILFNKDGIRLRQPQLHACGRHPWATILGEKLEVIDLPFGRLAIVVGGDAIYPEVFRLAVLQDVDVVAVPTKVLEAWEMSHGFLERSAENRMNVVVATQPSDAGTRVDA